MTEYKRFDEEKWGNFGQVLLKDRGPDEQKEFLEACKSKEDFLHYVDDELPPDSVVGDTDVSLKEKFSENEFLKPPSGTQEKIWDEFHNLPIETKIYCGFWGYVIVNMIRGDYIQPEYLAKSNNNSNTGIFVIDEAIRSKDDEKTTKDESDKKIDDCIRRILRSMGNPAPRGKRIIFHDCYLSRSYWRYHWADKMSKCVDLKFEQILEILNETYYSAFAAKMHTGKSCIGVENVLGGLLLYLDENRKIADKKEKITGSKLKKIIDGVSYLSIWKAIEAQEPAVNQMEIQKISESLLNESAKST